MATVKKNTSLYGAEKQVAIKPHDVLAEKATRFIKNVHACFIGAVNYSGAWSKERVDGIVFNGQASFLIEAKMSRSDFLADKKKSFRNNPSQGVGMFRYYACPQGLIQVEELPKKWGLIYQNDNGRCELVHGYGNCRTLNGKGMCWGSRDEEPFRFERSLEDEYRFLLFLAKRYKQQTFMGNIL